MAPENHTTARPIPAQIRPVMLGHQPVVTTGQDGHWLCLVSTKDAAVKGVDVWIAPHRARAY